MNQLSLNGSAEQKERFLPGLLSGDKVGALAMSEHQAGSDVVSMKTTAKQVDGGWVLNGTKMWITNVGWNLLPVYFYILTYIGPRCGLHRRIREDGTRKGLQRHYCVRGGKDIQGIFVRTETR